MTTVGVSTAVPTYSRWIDVPDGLRTKTQWRRYGRKPRKEAQPQAFFDSYYYGRTYELFAASVTRPVRSRAAKEPSILSFAEHSIAAAIQTINAAAKRRRDSTTEAYFCRHHGRAELSKFEKETFYDLKDAVLGRLLEQGRAKLVEYHSKTDRFAPPRPRRRTWHSDVDFKRFDDEFYDETEFDAFLDDDTNVRELFQTTVLEVIEFAGHYFHRPVDKPSDSVQIDKHLGDRLSPARPLGSIRLRDAEATLQAYLKQPRIVLPCEVVALKRPVTEGELIEAIAIPWLAICRELERNPTFLYDFVNNPRNFEEFIAASYKQAKFDDVILTPRSGDGGRDVIAVRHGHLSVRFLDQCKAYSANHVVLANDVRAMLGVITGDQNTSKGIITTTASFAPCIATDPIIAPYVPHRLELRDGKRLRDWLLTLVNSDTLNL